MTLTVCQQYWPLSSFKSAPEAAPSQFSDIWCMPAGFTISRTKFSVKALSRWFRRDQYLVGDGFGAPKLMASAKDNKFHALDLNFNRPRLPPTFPKPRDAPASVWHPTTKIVIEVVLRVRATPNSRLARSASAVSMGQGCQMKLRPLGARGQTSRPKHLSAGC